MFTEMFILLMILKVKCLQQFYIELNEKSNKIDNKC